MSSNLKVNKRSQKSFSVTRFSGFDGSRVQITTARDHRKDHDVSDKFFNSVNLNREQAQDLVETLMGFIRGHCICSYLCCGNLTSSNMNCINTSRN